MGTTDSSRTLRVAVLHGGEGAFRQENLASGQAIALALVQTGHQAHLIDPSATRPETIAWSNFDVCCLAMTSDAEASWQKQLEQLDIPHTGSSATVCQLAASRSAARQSFLRFFVPTPAFVVLRNCVSPVEAAARVASLGYPLLVRNDHPQQGSTVHYVRDAAELQAALKTCFSQDDRVLCERFLRGREFSVTLQGERALPPVEMPLPGDGTQPTDAPSETVLTSGELQKLQQTALLAAAAVGATGLIEVRLVLDQNGRAWVLEVETVPALLPTSPAARAAAKAGISMNDLCQWMVQDCLVAESLR